MDRTVTINVTPEEEQYVLAERARKSEIERKERAKLLDKRNTEAAAHKICFEDALRAIKDCKNAFKVELTEDSLPRQVGERIYHWEHMAAKKLGQVLDMVEIGMELVLECSKTGVERAWKDHPEGSKTLKAVCRVIDSTTTIQAMKAIKKMKDVDLDDTAISRPGGRGNKRQRFWWKDSILEERDAVAGL